MLPKDYVTHNYSCQNLSIESSQVIKIKKWGYANVQYSLCAKRLCGQ